MTALRRAAALLALLAAGCGADDPVGRSSTVGVVAEGCSLVESIGGGVLVGPGLVATNAHTVAGATAVEIDVDGTRLSATVVAFDKDVDIAILETASSREPAPLGNARVGEEATVETWHPDTGRTPALATVTRRLLVTIEDIYVEGEYEREAIEIDATIVAGDSGAPVYNRSGELLGIVYARSRARDGIGFAVRASEIERVLAQVGEPLPDTSRCR